LSWVDGTLCVLVVILAIIGWFRGGVAQVAAVAGILGGVGFGAVVRQWVGAHWESAHPTLVFWALGWLVSVLSALAIISLVNVLGDRLGRAIQAGPVGWLDRTLGVAAGTAMGIVMASLLLVAAARLPMGHLVERSLVQARAPRLLLAGGARVCRFGRRFPGARGLEREFVFAQHRLERETPAN